jgi:hypothetical protein
MSSVATVNKLKSKNIRAIVIIVVLLGSLALAALAVSKTETGIKAIVANPVMMDAFRGGLPSDCKLFPDGSKVAKIEWTFKRNTGHPIS